MEKIEKEYTFDGPNGRVTNDAAVAPVQYSYKTKDEILSLPNLLNAHW